MAPAFKLSLRHYTPKRCHMQTSLFHPGCWVAELAHRNALPFPRQGRYQLWEGKAHSHTPSCTSSQRAPHGKESQAFPAVSFRAVVGKTLLHGYGCTGLWLLCCRGQTHCTSHAQTVILNLVRKSWEDPEVPTRQYSALSCSKNKQFGKKKIKY